ncbi:sterol desaturase family protein [Hirschia baltica]|uniref:Fatty acid hydroxylase n=1 Tax=Hirschia baltica (strain ATCC 49814 / DSM 5838 / IFAM 1418) TaxID=582402 RepID=C6XQM4_HIRBI|nr:sterol desaturase family protein [Hirschia baltica]ACT58630.1 fatty acid hydroxylase [Hirschia baltica ATCC 49814]
MENFETILRLASFLGAFAIFALLEMYFPDRKRKLTRLQRWTGSFGLVILSNVLVKLALPLGLAAIAIWAGEQGVGLFNMVLEWPYWMVFIICFLALDLAIWFQHFLTHKIPFLWRLHRVHHTDPDVDVSTAFRFHPLEILISLGWKVLIVCVLGVPPVTIFWFQIVLNVSALFNHANILLPKWLDRIVRLLIVTPAMHRVHHSIERSQSDSNYGFFLPVWDKMFRTYRASFSNVDNAQIGQVEFQTKNDQHLDRLIVQPFK